MSFYLNLLLFILFNLFISFYCTESNKIIFLPFKTKNLRIGSEDPELEEYIKNINASTFLNKWFYNGIYSNIQIGKPSEFISTFFNFDNSYYSIGKCDELKHISLYSTTKEKLINSNTLTRNEKKDKDKIYIIGNDYFIFYNSSNYSIININKEYNGLDFIYEDDKISDDEKICGHIGLNFNYGENSNFIEQLKKKKIISKYIWTLDYNSLTKGNIIIGTEPHFYDTKYYHSYQYKTIYSKINNNKYSWAFNFDKIKLNESDIELKDTNVELLINYGLIIGTEEYKEKVDNLFFNKLIDEDICFKEVVKLNISEINNEYFVYYCNKLKFKGIYNNFSLDKKLPINSFNDILLYQNGFEYIFKMDKNMLFENLNQRAYFLIIFEKNNKNKVWKLGEPFLSKYKYVFNQEQKTIGFYNPLLKENINSDIDNKNKDNEGKDKNNNNISIIFIYLIIIMILIICILIIIYILKKIFEKKKVRANELVDNYEYIPNTKEGNNSEINNNSNNSFGIN